MDEVLAELVREAEDDPDTVAVVLCGSRSVGHERPDSDYDVHYVRLVAGKPPHRTNVEAAVITLDELRTIEPYWWTDVGEAPGGSADECRLEIGRDAVPVVERPQPEVGVEAQVLRAPVRVSDHLHACAAVGGGARCCADLVDPLLDGHRANEAERTRSRETGVCELRLQLLHIGEVRLVGEELVQLDRGPRAIPPQHAEERAHAGGEVEDRCRLGLELAHTRANRVGVERVEHVLHDR
jgi:predicted nucleotidyltransferase